MKFLRNLFTAYIRLRGSYPMKDSDWDLPPTQPLWQAPPPWRQNAISWRRHIRNITSFRNFESETLSDVKSMDKYWLNFVFLTSQDKNKTVQLWYGPPDIPRGVWWAVSRINTVLLLYTLYGLNSDCKTGLVYLGDVQFETKMILNIHPEH